MARLQVEAGTAIDLADGAIACTATESLTPDKPFVLRARNHQALYRFGRNPMAVQPSHEDGKIWTDVSNT